MIDIKEGRFYRTRDGRKVGPMRLRSRDTRYPWWSVLGSGRDEISFDYSGRYCKGVEHPIDLVSEWHDAAPTGPVREVPQPPKLEIVPGGYDRLIVHDPEGGCAGVVQLGVASGMIAVNAAELRTLASHLTRIADALEGGK